LLTDKRINDMKKVSILTSIAVLFGFLWSGVAAYGGDKIQIQAVPPEQQQRPSIQQWPVFLDCGMSEIIMNEFKGTRGEIEMLQGNGVIQIPGGKDMPGQTRAMELPVVQYFNPKTGTWSVIAHLQNGMSCVIVFGNQLKPFPGGLDNRKPAPPNLKKENLEEKMDRLQPVDPRDIKVLKDASGGELAVVL